MNFECNLYIVHNGSIKSAEEALQEILFEKETKNGSIVHSPVVCKQNISFENTVSSPKKEKTLPNVTMSSHLTKHFKLVTFSRHSYLWGVILCFQLWLSIVFFWKPLSLKFVIKDTVGVTLNLLKWTSQNLLKHYFLMLGWSFEQN